jgi:alpha-glucosidase (family GH31 glycosyl hydrolase)
MHKRLFKYILLALLFAGLLFLLVNWGLRENAIRQLSGSLTISDPVLANGDLHTYSVGSFTLTVSSTGQAMPGGYPGPRLYITHQAEPSRWLWHTLRGQGFIAAAQGQEKVQESRGSFFITDHLTRTCVNQTIESVQQNDQSISIHGKLDCGQDQFIGYTLSFKPAAADRLAFLLTFTSADSLRPDRTYLTYASDSDEHFFGFGEQFSYFDLKGQRVPIWVSEQGIGRGQQPVTALVNLAARSGGNDFTTYTAVPQYITSRMRSLFLENQEYSVFDLRRADRVQISVFSSQLQGQIVYGSNPEDLIAEYTAWAGRMRTLPDWILSGAVVGMQGGTDKVRGIYAKLKALGTPVAAFWLQDWVGQRTTSFGKQLWWNWELDTTRYPGWDALREDLAKDSVRIMLYASPFLADVAGLKPNLRRNLFKEALDAGYLVRRPDGSPYLIRNTDFSAGLLDLINPEAVTWYEGVLKTQMVDIGASGWMADFGEALPYDAHMSGEIPGSQYHNQYPVAWAALNRALIDSLPNSDQYVFFTRSGFSQSPQYTTLMWTGDQLTSWDAHDGMKSAVTGMLSGGMSGFSLNHADIGGYTGINNPLLHVQRSKELLLRWMELSAFTTVYRTHEGNTPDQNVQFYTDDDTLQQFDRFAKVYQAWGFLRKRLVQYSAETGVPVMRPLFIHYPNDPIVYTISYQEFMVGPDLLVAPVLDAGKNTVRVYLPAGNWVHVWSGVPYRSPFKGQWVTVPAPIGQPGLFVKEGIEDGDIFIKNLRQAGLIR